MAIDQHVQQRAFLGLVLAARGKYDEAQPILEQAWAGDGADHYGGLYWYFPASLARQVVEHLQAISVARGDAAGEARWREVLTSAAK